MSDTCHFSNCDNTSFDNCKICNQPTCKRHGKLIGDRYICNKCADKY
jgi:hypothetical protein